MSHVTSTTVEGIKEDCIDCFFFLFKLLDKKKRVQLQDMGEDLECLCQIMKTVGPKLDHEKAKVCMWENNHFILKFLCSIYSHKISHSSL